VSPGGLTGGSSGGGFWSTIATWAGSLFGGGHANGGPVSPGMFYEVGEGNKPEMLNMGGHSYLLPGNNGQVTPMRGGGGLSQVLNFNYAAPYDARTESQKNSRLAFETRRAMARNG
jgi:SLT domain-containing protein